MVNPLARKMMKNNLNDKDFQITTDYNNSNYNLDTKESDLIQKIIQGNNKTSRTITLDEAVERIKKGR